MNTILKSIYQGGILLLILSFIGFSGGNQLVEAEFHHELTQAESGEIIELNDIDSPTITVGVKSKDSIAQVQLRVSDIKRIAERLPSTLIELKTEWGSLIFPANFMDYQAWANKTGFNLDGLLLKLAFERVEQDHSAKTKLDKANLVSPIFRFVITLIAQGETYEITDYNGKYISSTLQLPGQTDTTELNAVAVDEATGDMSFIPALFHTIGNQTIAAIQTPHNGLFGIVHLHKAFTDLEFSPDKPDIELLASKRVVKGVTAARFEPEAIMNRASFITLLVRALGLKESPDSKRPFTDISQDAWYAGAVGAAIKAGIIKGYANSTLDPQKPITREQMAVMLAQALKFTNHIVNLRERADLLLADFTDLASISSSTLAAIEQVVDTGIMPGSSKTSFAPDESMTRAEAAVTIKRFMQFVHFID